MKPSLVSRLIGVLEFTDLCSWLDDEYGAAAKKFDVLEVWRGKNGKLTMVKVVLLNNKSLKITPELIRARKERRKKELEKIYAA